MTYSALASACGEGDNAAMALELVQEMLYQAGFPHVIPYSALIRACAKDDKAARALELVQATLDQGLAPERYPLQRLDQCLCEGSKGSTGPGARPGDAGPRPGA